MKVLITGGAGFIGSAVIRHVIHNTLDAVVNLDKLTYAGNLETVSSVSMNERYAFEQVDICDRQELDRVFNEHQPDAVMHHVWNRINKWHLPDHSYKTLQSILFPIS